MHRTVAGDTLASLACAEYGDPTHWRALAAYNAVDDPMRLPTGAVAPAADAGGAGPMIWTERPLMSFSSQLLVEIDGKDLPADVVPLLVSAYVDDSQRLPDMFALRFRDPERMVLTKSGAKVGAQDQGQGPDGRAARRPSR